MNTITFPSPENRSCNMMPIIMGDDNTIPEHLKSYIPLINLCNFRSGDTVYLTVEEKLLHPGDYLRRPGIHTDATNRLGWGGGDWGQLEGIYIASNDGATRVWEQDTTEVDSHGSLLTCPKGPNRVLSPNELVVINDTTPHETLVATHTHHRQFFRLVSPKIGGWFSQHSTPNPFGVQSKAKIITESKFA